MLRFLFALSTLAFSLGLSAQNAVLEGGVYDAETGEALIGVNIAAAAGKGTTTDFDGKFILELPAGTYELVFSYIGFQSVTRPVNIKAGANPPIIVKMGLDEIEFDEVVVSGSRYAKRVSEEVISIEVIKTSLADNTLAIKLDDLAKRVTGLNVADGQASIRAGSSWSYSVGSRVNIVMDGQSMLTPDRSSIKWRYLPMENIGQVEVLKGASSILYGSSAMNGTIHLQTIRPTSTPVNKFVSYVEMLDKYENDEYNWWSDTRVTTGGYFSRAHKVSDHFEYVVGVNSNYTQQAYFDYNDYHFRTNLYTKWTSKKDNRSTYGFHLNYTFYKENEFIFWKGSGPDALFPIDDVGYSYQNFNVDPFYSRYDKKGNKHLVQGRVYYFDPGIRDERRGGFLNTEYQFSKRWESGWSLIAGALQEFIVFNDNAFEDPFQSGLKWAAYAQVDKKWDRLSMTAGMRSEMYKIGSNFGAAYAFVSTNDAKNEVTELPIPLMRFGLNYKAGKNSYVRFNIGQAFRLPSLIEYFVDYEFSGISILSNDELRPEYGWTSEVGYKQHWGVSKTYTGTIDIALFWQEYKDLIEFQPTLVGNIALVPQNLPNARIAGYEVSLKQSITQGQHRVGLDFGYTYAFPVELSGVEGIELRNVGNYLKSMFKYAGRIGNTPRSVQTEALLKYRNRHLVNLVLEYENDHFLYGVYGRYYSYIENGDFEFDSPTFSFIPGIVEYWERKYPQGDFVLDMNFGVKIRKMHTISLTIKNITNREYSLRLAKIEAPRSFAWKYQFVF